MAGYISTITTDRANSKSRAKSSPLAGIFTFGKEAREAFDTKLRSLKSSGCKMGEPVEYEKVPFETSGEDRQVLIKCEGVDKEGGEVVIMLERFHVGGGAAKRGINAGGPTVAKAKKPAKKRAKKAPKPVEEATS
jgi:hypothetical protein